MIRRSPSCCSRLAQPRAGSVGRLATGPGVRSAWVGDTALLLMPFSTPSSPSGFKGEVTSACHSKQGVRAARTQRTSGLEPIGPEWLPVEHAGQVYCRS